MLGAMGIFCRGEQRCGAGEGMNGGRRRPYIKNWRSDAPLDGVILRWMLHTWLRGKKVF